ncbi:MAG: phosphoenolpyruvate synthase [Deltaproteobacteria bacterium]|nr:phosphoenolpyruvate synthase [Deltaproteobacteria bacterium]
MSTVRLVRRFSEIGIDDIALVGGKNASLGEMFQALSKKGVIVPDGFAITTDGYRAVLEQDDAASRIKELLHGIKQSEVAELKSRAKKIRSIISHLQFPAALNDQIRGAYRELCREYNGEVDVAVRSSATAEDLPEASFAGQQESYLNIRGEEELLLTCRKCFASLFTDRAISYRIDHGVDHLSVALSIGVQKMVRSDLASAGVIFTVDTESGFRDVVLVTSSYGLGENVVKGKVVPDEFSVFKPTLQAGFDSIIEKNLGSKKIMLVYSDDEKAPVGDVRVPKTKRDSFSLTDQEVLQLARWAIEIESYYTEKSGRAMPMDIEWAKDGVTGELFIVQARPETVVAGRDFSLISQYALLEKGELLTEGRSIGQKIGAGTAQLIRSARDIESFSAGNVLVTENTDPDWEPIMKRAAAIVTDHGGRTSHAAIVSRELGIPCIVGCGDATRRIPDGEQVTVSCSEGESGKIYRGKLKYERREISLKDLPSLRTKLALNIASPESAFELSFLPNDGVGLVRIEFIITSQIKAHPLALIGYNSLSEQVRAQIDEVTLGFPDKQEFFVEKLAQGVGKIAAAFYPKPVIVRMSDFKSNEYAHLLGGEKFEPQEENPMIGWRGASRYYHPGYKQGFALECKAIKKAREEYGLTNIKVMIPFCRTVEEGKKVLETMKENGLARGSDGLEIYVMCEIPSNVLLAEEFLQVFDGFSIGSNDLTQLTLGLDRDSDIVSPLFDERNPAVMKLISSVIGAANKSGKYIGICGDAPSTHPDFAAFLVRAGIGTISISPDAMLTARQVIAKEEGEIGNR